MKVCKYCGAESPDSASVCSACGASGFQNKCVNCGTIFEEGNYCPRCGVKVGAKIKTCPNCGAEYYSAACPSCGYIKKYSSSESTYASATQTAKAQAARPQPVKKRRTGLWILGWLFIFPLPLTILVVRNKKMNSGAKAILITVAWILYVMIGKYYDSNGSSKNATNSGRNTTQATATVAPVHSNTPAPVISPEPSSIADAPLYAGDSVINRFITEFNSNSPYEITDITGSNLRTEYYGYANGRHLEMLNANDAAAKAFCLTINGGQDDKAKQSMLDVFREVIKILDSSISTADIDSAITEFEGSAATIEGYKLGKTVSVNYVPIKEVSYGKTSCRVVISCSNFK